MGFWDDEYDIPLNHKRIVSRINRFLKIDINEINKSWALRSNILQKKFIDYFNNNLKRKYLRKNTLYIISNTVNEDVTNQVESKIYEIPTTFKSDEDRQVFIDCTNELIKLNQYEIVKRQTNDLTLDNISTLFKNITPSFLNIKCQDNISNEGSGKVFIIMLTNEDVNALTGFPSSNGYGWYLKAQFSPRTNNIYDKNGVDENNGIVSIDCIKLIIKFISAKNGNKAIYNIQ